jgi:hypothetical protein
MSKIYFQTLSHRAVLCLILASLAVAGWPSAARSAEAAKSYYVSNSGSDSNDGLSLSTPFRTIQRCAELAAAGDTCLIRGGIYRETITPLHDGTSAAPITFAAYNHEAVTINGADEVSGWSPSAGQVYRTHLTWNLNQRTWGQITNNQVFVDGVMMPEARWPNIPVAHTTRLSNTDKARADSATRHSNSSATYSDNALNGFSENYWQGAKINFGPGYSTVHTTCDVTASTPGAIRLQCNPDPGASNSRTTWNQEDYYPSTGNYYYLWGKQSELDSPGEWFLDASGELFLWAPDSASPAAHRVEVKRRLWAFDLSSRAYIHLEGLRLFAATVKTDTFSHHLRLENLHFQYLWHFQEIPPLFITEGTNGLEINGEQNLIVDCDFADTAGAMLALKGFQNEARNNVIYNAAYMGHAPAVSGKSTPVNPGGSDKNTFRSNTVFDTGHYEVDASAGLDIKFNDLYNSHLQIMDLGSIYGHGIDGHLAEIAYNLVHDNWAEYDESLKYYGGHGIYLDDDTYNYKVYRNVIWHTSAPGIFLHGVNGTTSTLDPKPPSSTTPSNRYIYNNTVEGTLGARAKTNYNGLPQTLAGSYLRNNIAAQVDFDDPNLIAQANYVGDGIYINGAEHNYALRSYSPAVNAGLNLGSPYMDAPMQPVSTPDIGAYEFGRAGFVAGATLRLPDLTNLTYECAANAGQTADCIITQLPIGRKLPADFQIRVGETGQAAQTCLTQYDYTSHGGTGICSDLSTTSLSGEQAIWIQFGGSGWINTGATVDLGPLAVTALNPSGGPDFGKTLVSISGRGFADEESGYATPLTVNNPAANALYKYPVLLTFNSAQRIQAGKLRPDCGDLRFYDTYGLLDYWLEDGCNTAATHVWVKMPYLPGGNSQILMRYGLPQLTSASNGRRTFVYFDGFDDNTLDTNYWSLENLAGASVTQTGGQLRLTGSTSSANRYATFGFNLYTSRIVIPTSFALDTDLTLAAPSSSAVFKAGVGSEDLSLFGGGNDAFKDIGAWQNGWVSFGKSTIHTAQINRQKISVAYIKTGDRYSVRWFENGDLTTVRAQRSNLSSAKIGYFFYGPDQIASFDVRFDNVRIRPYTYPEPTVSLGAETETGLQVTFDGLPCTTVLVQHGGRLTCYTPAHAPGAVDVTVTNPGGEAYTFAQGFSYFQTFPAFLPLITR